MEVTGAEEQSLKGSRHRRDIKEVGGAANAHWRALVGDKKKVEVTRQSDACAHLP